MSYDNWISTTIDEISLKVFSGGTPSTKNPAFWNGSLPWLSSGETRNNFITETEKTITQEGVEGSSTRLAHYGDIVIASAGQGFTRGQTSICKIDTYINQSIVAVRCNPKIAHDMFVYYNINNRYNELRAISDGHSIRGSLTTKLIKGLDISLPSLQEQKAIANILSSLDDKIELNNKINKNLEEMAQTLYKQWFIDFEFPNEDGESYKSSGGEMIESELGLIPKGWEVVRLGDILSLNKRGLAPKYTDDLSIGIPVINQRCIRNHTIIEEAVQYHDNTRKLAKEFQYHKEWDVLVNSMGVGTLGRVSVSSMSDNRLVHSCVTILRSNEKVKKEVFAQIMLSLEPTFTAMGEGSTGQTSIKNKLIDEIKIILPSRSIQKVIAEIFNDIQSKIDVNYNESMKLAKTRDILLPKLMSGEIEAPIEG